MAKAVQEKIDRILDRVIESGSGLSIAQLGLVQKVRVNGDSKRMTLFLKGMPGTKACCMIMTCAMLADIELRLTQEFQREFPGFEICLANA